MAEPIEITLAIDRYDRHLPFFDGTVGLPASFNLNVLQVGQTADLRDGGLRHERMLQEGDFDVAELSLASYITACGKGMPYTAIPVFPRRLFAEGQVFVHTDAPFETPGDLDGRTIGLQSFQTTLAVLAKGVLGGDYGLDLRSVKWRTKDAETVDVALGAEWNVARLESRKPLPRALLDGEIDALFFSRTPEVPGTEEGAIRRLFPDPRVAEEAAYQRHGYCPIMHVVALKDDIAERYPDLPGFLIDAFEEADRLSSAYMADPNWSRLAWMKYTREEEQRRLGAALWSSGLAANRPNLETFIGYARDQGLIDRPILVEELFHPSVCDT